MVMNVAGTRIYLGSPQGLMTIATSSNNVSNANDLVQGTVLSVSPNGNTVVVTNPALQTVSLVSTATNAITTSYNGVGTSAVWSPDSNTVYITTTANTVLVYSPYTNWQSATTSEIYSDAAVTVPSVGAYFAGTTTEGRSYCASSTIPNTTILPPTVDNTFLPLVDDSDTSAPTDQITATTNGTHILGAHAAGTDSIFSDIDVTLPDGGAGACPIPGTTAAQPAPGYFTSSQFTETIPQINAATITGVEASSNSYAAFVTYTLASTATTGGGVLPLYSVPPTGSGAITPITLGNGATAASAPESGVFSTDNLFFYVGTGAADGTSADNDVHILTMTYSSSGVPSATETGILTPELPVCYATTSQTTETCGSGYAPVNLIAEYPKKPTT